MRLFLINKNKCTTTKCDSVLIFLNKTHVVVFLIFLQQNPSGTIPKSFYSNPNSMYLIYKNKSSIT